MDEWISFEDEFPLNEGKVGEVLTFEYLIHTNGKKIPHISIERVEDLRKDANGTWSDTGGEDLTHWMRLPGFPKRTRRKKK